MELLISHSSFVVPSIIPPDKHSTYKAFSSDHDKYSLTTKEVIKPSNFPSRKLIMPVGLRYSKSSFSKSLSYSQHKRNSFQVCAQVEPSGPCSVTAKISRLGSAYMKFVRPYFTINSIISAISLFARVIVENPQLFTWSLLFKAFLGLVAISLSCVYTSAINDIFDVDIDRVNKPYLPIAAGEISIRQAWFIVIFDVLAGLLILRMLNADVITTSLYCLYLFILAAYSAPPIRFKRSPITTIIMLPMSTIVQISGILYATTASLGLPFWWSPPNVFLTTFMVVSGIVICIIKDISDVEGDLKHNIRTLASIHGPRNIAFLGTGMLLVNYIGAIVGSIYMPRAFKYYVLLPAHTIFALGLLSQAWKLDKANYSKEESTHFYHVIWMLLNLEYLLFPFI